MVLFTSGSESTPKAVPLSHRNLLANGRASIEVLQLTNGDRMLGFLQTTWGSFGNFLKAYTGDPAADKRMLEVVDCMKQLFGTLNP